MPVEAWLLQQLKHRITATISLTLIIQRGRARRRKKTERKRRKSTSEVHGKNNERLYGKGEKIQSPFSEKYWTKSCRRCLYQYANSVYKSVGIHPQASMHSRLRPTNLSSLHSKLQMRLRLSVCAEILQSTSPTILPQHLQVKKTSPKIALNLTFQTLVQRMSEIWTIPLRITVHLFQGRKRKSNWCDNFLSENFPKWNTLIEGPQGSKPFSILSPNGEKIPINQRIPNQIERVLWYHRRLFKKKNPERRV